MSWRSDDHKCSAAGIFIRGCHCVDSLTDSAESSLKGLNRFRTHCKVVSLSRSRTLPHSRYKSSSRSLSESGISSWPFAIRSLLSAAQRDRFARYEPSYCPCTYVTASWSNFTEAALVRISKGGCAGVVVRRKAVSSREYAAATPRYAAFKRSGRS